MTLKNDRYSYRVIWSDKDDGYLGLCAEFPSLSWLAGTPEAASQGIRRVVAEGIDIMEADGDSIPEPLSNKKYSGKFSVRIPPEVHRNLSILSSLNIRARAFGTRFFIEQLLWNDNLNRKLEATVNVTGLC